MEDLVLNSEEYKVIIHNKDFLEKKFFVKICVPEFESSNENDIIFAAIHGNVNNIKEVKEFMNVKLRNDVLILSEDNNRSLHQNEVPVITLSDSDTEVIDVPICSSGNQTNNRRKKKRKKSVIDLTSSPVCNDDSVCEVSSTTVEPASKRRIVYFFGTESHPLRSEMTQNFFPKSNQTVETELSLQQNHKMWKSVATKPKRKRRRKVHKSKCFPAEEFIPIRVTVMSESKKSNNPLPVVKPKDPKLLRPIVIDGSNVARQHGKKDNTFSCKGIKLSIEYFLQRGHTQVTAFVPNFRRHCKFGPVATTDQPLLEDLANSGHVVFTPSRRVNGRRVTCYDDRFIVELASKTGGVILSNDNYHDLIEENESFKKTIEERLLMFCFVDDILMIPQDPLGRNGPSLEEYLSFPEDQK